MYDVQISSDGSTWITVGFGMALDDASTLADLYRPDGLDVALWGPTAAGFGRLTASAS